MPVCGPIQVPLNRESRSFWLTQSYASPSKKRRAVCAIFLGEWRNALAQSFNPIVSQVHSGRALTLEFRYFC